MSKILAILFCSLLTFILLFMHVLYLFSWNHTMSFRSAHAITFCLYKMQVCIYKYIYVYKYLIKMCAVCTSIFNRHCKTGWVLQAFAAKKQSVLYRFLYFCLSSPFRHTNTYVSMNIVCHVCVFLGRRIYLVGCKNLLSWAALLLQLKVNS